MDVDAIVKHLKKKNEELMDLLGEWEVYLGEHKKVIKQLQAENKRLKKFIEGEVNKARQRVGQFDEPEASIMEDFIERCNQVVLWDRPALKD